MKNYGKVIRYFRLKQNLTRKELAEGICSKDYIYLLEAGKRRPSVEFLDKISARLKVDWHDYLYVIDMSNPIDAKDVLDELMLLMKAERFEELIKLVHKVRKKEWSREYPFNDELIVKEAYARFKLGEDAELMMQKIDSVIDDIELDNVASFKSFSLVQLKALNIMMIIDFESGQKELGEQILYILVEELESRKQMRSYSELYISVRLNHLKLLQMKKEHIDDIIVKSMKLLQYQTDYNLNRRTGHTLAILGSCFANLKDYKNAKQYYEAAICLCRLYDHKEQEKIYEEIVEGISMKE